MSSKQTATIEPCGNGFAVAVGGEIIRAGFVSRGHASMWASRQHLYERKTPRRRQIELPPDLGDLRIVRSTHAAKIVGSSYPRFLEESRAGLWGPRVQISGNSFGHALGDLKRGLAARTIKDTAA
jgi:hypothetical protein